MKEMLKKIIASRCDALGVHTFEEEVDVMADTLVSSTWLGGGAQVDIAAVAALTTLGLLELRQVGEHSRYVPCYTQVG